MTSQNISLKSLLTLNNNDFKEFVCGWGAAVINVSITFPINKIVFRQVCKLFSNILSTACIYVYKISCLY